MELQKLKNIIEAILLSAEKPVDINHFDSMFELDEERPSKDEIRQALAELESDYEGRGMRLKQVSSGYRLQIPEDYAIWVARLWEEKPPRYSRALLETLVLIAYRQPITRGEIEEIRGVSVSSQIIKTLSEREWIRVLGHKDVPGKPSMYGTTREFLDYFNLKTLDELPALSEIKDLDKIHPELSLEGGAGNEFVDAVERAVEMDAADTDIDDEDTSISATEAELSASDDEIDTPDVADNQQESAECITDEDSDEQDKAAAEAQLS